MRERPAARLFGLDEDNRLLLFRYDWTLRDPKVVTHWTTPGGALDDGETYEEAAHRELFEETGLKVTVGEPVFHRTAQFQMGTGEWVNAEERYYIIRTSCFEIPRERIDHPTSTIKKNYRWWKLDELQQSEDVIYPEQLADVIVQLCSRPEHMNKLGPIVFS
ncbi:RNA pyrophosphohydrolase [Pseudovibrio axinellae]|uniref:RNA pyrophosphohydrolase n=1 Tax=Pseudovibrio axinellae TaxID=989403 RepID=A0A165WNY3_9HYPH|nr:NUDIX domain-containing protein [Pseudovibrio axinellae]KZL16744.1 RNA pyrophosphohydrolase [Pseudovibrio axinellae]SEQ76398.1 NUDIX domain-containing protein [Pseudovibrio axinellae]